MKVEFLGTGTSQGVPIIGVNHPVCLSSNPKDQRLRSSILIETETTTLTIDCGPDFRQQMLRTQNKRLHAILFTHEHSDHTAGLDDIRPYTYQGNHLIQLFALKRVCESIQKRFDYFFATENRYPGAPQVQLNEIEGFNQIKVNELDILALPITHGKLPILGYRIGKFAYITDSTFLSEETYAALQNLEVLVINALRKEPHPAHNHLNLALEHIERISPQKTYLTHIGFEMGFHDEVNKELPQGVELAYDGLQFEVNK